MSDGPFHPAPRLNAVSESKTTRVFSQAQALRRQGKDIISLAVGEPDFETPGPIINATMKALQSQQTKYGPVGGIETLREQLSPPFEHFGPQNIIVTNGAKQALYSLFQVLCDIGDEIILPKPCWVSFTEQIKLAGAVPVLVDTRHDHQLAIDAIEKAVTARTRAILVNTPNNPSGAVYPEKDLRSLAQLAHKRGLLLIADEAYHAFTYNGTRHVCLADIAPDPQQVITIRSFSKQYNMTGFRLGYAAASREIIAAMIKLQSHLCGNVCSFAQHGALAALALDASVIEDRRTVLEQRRRTAYDLAADLFDCVSPQGAFYLFPDVRRHLTPGQSSESFALRLLEQCGVAVVPGEAFHQPGHIRISFGADESEIREAFERIGKVL